MSDLAKGIIVGVMVAVVLAGFAVAAVDYWPHLSAPKRDHRPAVTVARIGSGGKSDAWFGEGLKNRPIPGSSRYDFCFGDLRVQRPSMITTDMPTAYCSVTRRGNTGAWRISTGGWQECQAVCVKFRKP